MSLPKSTFTATNAIEGIVDAIKDGDRQGVKDILKFTEANGISVPFVKGQVRQLVPNANDFFGDPFK